ncbi:DUF222 domain-containing protein [Herbiconiux sp. UC225_62]|uniref:HNH endonuclease signature motif containing protein n=1 Tax=Herbiconiux sp. UC225_62 TaxID=3350168 RepID=UPI0036D412CD
MNQSTVVFTPAPAPGPDAHGHRFDVVGDARAPVGPDMPFDPTRQTQSLGELGARFDAVVRGIQAEDAVVAASDARRTRLLAEAAALSDRMARLDGSAGTATGREWARRKLATEIACATHRSEREVTILIDFSENLVDHLPATLTALEHGTISFRHAQVMVAHARTLPEETRPTFEIEVLPHAVALPAHRFEDHARRHRELTHPESITTRTKAAREERYVAFHPDPDGMATLYHHLPATDALAIDDLIDRLARSDRATPDGGRTISAVTTDDTDATAVDGAPQDAGAVTSHRAAALHAAATTQSAVGVSAGEESNTDASTTGNPDARTHAQRRCDALTDLILGRRDRPRITPTILITAPATTIARASDDPGTLHGYGPIDPDTTRAIAATAPTFLRALLSPDTGAPTTITRHRHRPTAGPVPPRVVGATPPRPFNPPTSPDTPTTLDTPTKLNTPATLDNAAGALDAPTPISDTDTDTGTAGTTDLPNTASTARPGRDRYTPSPVLRTALALLDETCRFPGCGRRANRCELDHTKAWADGGTTTPDNLSHLCTRHHHLKHEGGWTVTPTQDGTRGLTWTSPRGIHYSTTPDPPPPPPPEY